MTDVPSFVSEDPKQIHHSATTWNVPDVLGAWYVTVRVLGRPFAVAWIVPPGHGPKGGVSNQVQAAPLFSVMLHSLMELTHVEHKPLTVAFNVTWSLAAIVMAAGEMATVTLLGSNPPPPPQPGMTASRMSDPTQHSFDIESPRLQIVTGASFDIGESVSIAYACCNVG